MNLFIRTFTIAFVVLLSTNLHALEQKDELFNHFLSMDYPKYTVGKSNISFAGIDGGTHFDELFQKICALSSVKTIDDKPKSKFCSKNDNLNSFMKVSEYPDKGNHVQQSIWKRSFNAKRKDHLVDINGKKVNIKALLRSDE